MNPVSESVYVTKENTRPSFFLVFCVFSGIWDGPLLLNVRGERGSGSKLRATVGAE